MARRRITALLLAASSACTGQPPEEPPVLPEPQSALEARARFCELVFPPGKVARLAGTDRLTVRPPTAEAEPGVGTCQLASSAGEIELVADCRPEHPRLAAMREVLADQDGFRELAIGSGGVASGAPDGEVHRLVFVTDEPSCALYLTATRLSAEGLEPVGRHVAKAMIVQRGFGRPPRTAAR